MPIKTVNTTTYECDGCGYVFVKDNEQMYFGGQPWSNFSLAGIVPGPAISISHPKSYCLCNCCSHKVDQFISNIEKKKT